MTHDKSSSVKLITATKKLISAYNLLAYRGCRIRANAIPANACLVTKDASQLEQLFQNWIGVFEVNKVALSATSFLICALILFLRGHMPRLSGRADDLTCVQASHGCLTPRVGGIAIFAAIGLSIAFAYPQVTSSYGKFILATSILFIVGLMEDLGYRVTPMRRLLAAAAASLVAIWLLGVWMPRAGIPGLDLLVTHWAIGIPLTVLITAGFAHAFNLIDGTHGLATFTGIAAALALSLIAKQAGYVTMAHLSMMLAAALFGFFLLNYPFGLIFLGDAGAYTVGFVLSWFGIAILLNSPDVSPWAILLTLFWPMADTMLAIYRRMRRNSSIFAPDRLHAHQMVRRTLEICFLARDKRNLSNPLTALVLAPFIIAPPIAGILLWNETFLSFAAVVAFGALFAASYAMAPWLNRKFKRKAPVFVRTAMQK